MTGISGTERIKMLEEIRDYCQNVHKKKVIIHDVAQIINEEKRRQKLQFDDNLILDVDQNVLKMLRAAAAKEVNIRIAADKDTDLHLIALHATFRWEGRLLPGMSYVDVIALSPDGFVCIVDDVKEVHDRNCRNPKWNQETELNLEQTQEWMIEEEFVTEVLADVISKPLYLVARKHHISNISDLFFTDKKKIYLSYPITAVKEQNPDILDRIQGEILEELEKLFVVFDPLAIKDMSLVDNSDMKFGDKIPALLDQLTPEVKHLLKSRTVERDFQFIDQSDAIVVFYLTDKVSPGVLAEIYYAHRNTKRVFACFSGKISPFLEDAVTEITPDLDKQMEMLREFSGK